MSSYEQKKVSTQRERRLSIIILTILAAALLFSFLNDNLLQEKLLPAAGIITLVILIRNIGEQH